MAPEVMSLEKPPELMPHWNSSVRPRNWAICAMRSVANDARQERLRTLDTRTADARIVTNNAGRS